MSTINSGLKGALLATAVALAVGGSVAYASDTQSGSNAQPSSQSSSSMSGKDKATAIGAGGGAVAGAVVGGPIGAVVGAGIGAVVGHEGTDANGHVPDTSKHMSDSSMNHRDNKVAMAQTALNDKGYNVAVDGRLGPNTKDAVRSFQDKNGLSATGTLDSETLAALGVKS